MKGFIVFYINVGTLPPYKAEAFVERMKDKLLTESFRKKLGTWEYMFIPTRTGETRVEVICLDTTYNDELEYLDTELEKSAPTPADFVYPKQEEIKDYILLMLGAPVIKVELDDSHLDFCYNEAKKDIEEALFSKRMTLLQNTGSLCFTLKGLALARAKIILGRIRGKYDSLPKMNDPLAEGQEGEPCSIRLDGQELLNEGIQELREYEERLRIA